MLGFHRKLRLHGIGERDPTCKLLPGLSLGIPTGVDPKQIIFAIAVIPIPKYIGSRSPGGAHCVFVYMYILYHTLDRICTVSCLSALAIGKSTHLHTLLPTPSPSPRSAEAVRIGSAEILERISL